MIEIEYIVCFNQRMNERLQLLLSYAFLNRNPKILLRKIEQNIYQRKLFFMYQTK